MTPPAVPLSLPFTGRWLVQNSPARRVPSHGTHLLGSTYAIDFVAVDAGRATADRRDWRTLLATEPNERFVGCDRPVLAPVDGEVVGTCGNSGNSTQPHVHLQATDHPDVSPAHGVPVLFRGFSEEPVRGRSVERAQGMPAEGSVVEPSA